MYCSTVLNLGRHQAGWSSSCYSYASCSARLRFVLSTYL